MSDKYIGPVYAKVTDNKDPDKLGRVKVSFESMGKSIESDWLSVLNLFGGSFYIPDLNQHVVVAFVNGSPKLGVVLGAVWTNKNKPPKSGENPGSDFNQDGKNTMRCIITPGGNKIIIDDKKGDAKIQVINCKGKNRLEFLSKKKKIYLKTDKKVVIDAGRNVKLEANEVDYQFSKDLEITAKAINFTEKEKTNIKATKDMIVKANSIKLN